MIIIDATGILCFRLLKKKRLTGIERVCLEYINHYKNKSCASLAIWKYYFVFSPENSALLFDWLLCPSSVFRGLIIAAKGIIGSLLIQTPEKSYVIQIYNVPIIRALYEKIVIRKKLKPIFFIHDLIPINYPEYCIPKEDIKASNRMRTVLSFASGIICNSKATQDDLINLSEREKIPMPPSVSILLAPGFKPSSQKTARPMESPYFVILGTIDPRKNHYLLLHIWRNIAEKLGNNAPTLVIIGNGGFMSKTVKYMISKCDSLQTTVKILSKCSDSELSSWLKHSQALLFPSFCEGYGLPLAEALAMSIPVITSNLPVFKEIAGDIPEYIDPLDGKEWEKIIIEYSLLDSQLRAAQLNRMKNLCLSTWEEHFIKVDSFISKLGS